MGCAIRPGQALEIERFRCEGRHGRDSLQRLFLLSKKDNSKLFPDRSSFPASRIFCPTFSLIH
jgi:hypothetical protein